MIKLRWTVLAAAVASVVSASLQAQVIEEVVVTAQKRAQSVSDIGVTISAFSNNDVKDLGFRKPQDIAANTPGLSAVSATSGGTPIFAIRGIGLDDFNSNNTSGVGVYIDEVLAPYPVFLNGQLMDVERIEVLKGPQGTLYGKNTTGGAINYISVKPTEEFEGYLTAGYSRWNTLKLEGAIAGSLGKSMNSRLAFVTENGDGWQEDIDTGEEYGETDMYALRSLTSFDFGGSTDLLLNLHYTKDEGKPLSPQNTSVDAVFGLPPGSIGTVSDNPADVRVGDLPVSRDEEGYGVSVSLNVDLEVATLTSITAYDVYDRFVVDNYDGIALSTDDFLFEDEFEVFSQELRLTSNSSGAFTWVAGLTYSYDEVDATTTSDVTDLIDTILFLNAGAPLGTVQSAKYTSDYVQQTTSLGAYLHTETELTEALRLTVGVRYSEDEREFVGGTTDVDGWNSILELTSPVPTPGAIVAELDDTRTDDNVSGKIGLDYAINDDWLVYGSVSTSYKAGVFYASPAGAPEALSFVEPEEIVALEVGFKASLLDNTMQINGAIYTYEYEDRQSLILALSTVTNTAFASLGNVPESEVTGAEIDFRWLPTEGLDLRAGVSFIDAEVTKSPGDTVRGLPLVQPIEEGERLSQAPEWSYNVVARYEWGMFGSYTAAGVAQYTYVDEQTLALGDAQGIYGESSSTSLRFTLEPESLDWIVTVWGSNLQDNRDTTSSFTSPEGGQVVYRQMPRNYGVDFTYNF